MAVGVAGNPGVISTGANLVGVGVGCPGVTEVGIAVAVVDAGVVVAPTAIVEPR